MDRVVEEAELGKIEKCLWENLGELREAKDRQLQVNQQVVNPSESNWPCNKWKDLTQSSRRLKLKGWKKASLTLLGYTWEQQAKGNKPLKGMQPGISFIHQPAICHVVKKKMELG